MPHRPSPGLPVTSVAQPFFEVDTMSAADAITKAQHIAFAPMVFQAARSLRNLGILAMLDRTGGATQEAIVQERALSEYGVRVLLEAGLGIGLLICCEGVYKLTKTGWFILKDRMTIANMDFSHDVCYDGMGKLEASIVEHRPAGLGVFGNWSTIYQGLAYLPPAATRSWYAFDHYYSDDAYPLVMPMIARHGPRSILDIGGNTGRFSLQCLRYDPGLRTGIADLPNMTTLAEATMQEHGFTDRVSFHPTDLLDPATPLPTGYDAVWMSQFLDCFSDDQIIEILQKVRAAITDDTLVFIMEPFWDRQRREVAAFSLQMTSLYFTSLANGNSQMYAADVFLKLVERAGLRIVEQTDHIGVCQTLLVCRTA